jgi:hypothetical protein
VSQGTYRVAVDCRAVLVQQYIAVFTVILKHGGVSYLKRIRETGCVCLNWITTERSGVVLQHDNEIWVSQI